MSALLSEIIRREGVAVAVSFSDILGREGVEIQWLFRYLKYFGGRVSEGIPLSDIFRREGAAASLPLSGHIRMK